MAKSRQPKTNQATLLSFDVAEADDSACSMELYYAHSLTDKKAKETLQLSMTLKQLVTLRNEITAKVDEFMLRMIRKK